MWRREAGLTLVELLVTVLISALLMALTFNMVMGSRTLYDTDNRRIDVNQNLRTALLMLSNDVRQAGERMPSSFPALQVIDGASDELVVNRSLLDVVLPLCKKINAGSAADSVFVAKYGGAPGLPEQCKDADPARLASWQAYRLANGTGSPKKMVAAYIWDPKNVRGEFFGYDQEDSSGQHIHRASGRWQYSYRVEDEPQIYILEQRRYVVDDGSLTMAQNGAAPAPVAPNITAFQATAQLKDGSSVAGSFPTGGATWKSVKHLTLSLTGQATSRGRTTTRTLAEDVTPRNSYSAED